MKRHLGVLVGLAFSAAPAVAQTNFAIERVDGDWVNASPAPYVTIHNSGVNGGKSTARWGTSIGYGQSGYDFVSAATPVTVSSNGSAFALGSFTHLNYPIVGTALTNIDLALSLQDIGVFDVGTTFSFTHNETPNNTGGPADNDLVTITNPVVDRAFSYDGGSYYFNLFGFSQDGGATISTTFSTVEGKANTATLYGRITEAPLQAPEPATFAITLAGLGLVGWAARRKAANGGPRA